jgi:type II secretory pathway predicted ATPase ExeA
MKDTAAVKLIDDRTPIDFTDSERIHAIRSLYVGHTRIEALISHLEGCMAQSGRYTEPPCVAIVGIPGVGKSTAAHRLLKKNPSVETDTGVIKPVVHVTIPAGATFHSMAEKILYVLTDPNYSQGSTSQKTLRIISYLADMKVKLLLVDEFQHLYDKNRARILKNETDWIKTLLIDSGVATAILGTLDAIEIIKDNAELSRRTHPRFVLQPFQYDREYQTLLAGLETQLQLKQPSFLWRDEIAFKIHDATAGVVGHTVKLLQNAAIGAIKQGTEKIDASILAEAYHRHLEHDRPGHHNPFVA